MMTPSAAPTAWMPLTCPSLFETNVPVMIRNSPMKPLVPGRPTLAIVAMTKSAA